MSEGPPDRYRPSLHRNGPYNPHHPQKWGALSEGSQRGQTTFPQTVLCWPAMLMPGLPEALVHSGLLRPPAGPAGQAIPNTTAGESEMTYRWYSDTRCEMALPNEESWSPLIAGGLGQPTQSGPHRLHLEGSPFPGRSSLEASAEGVPLLFRDYFSLFPQELERRRHLTV